MVPPPALHHAHGPEMMMRSKAFTMVSLRYQTWRLMMEKRLITVRHRLLE